MAVNIRAWRCTVNGDSLELEGVAPARRVLDIVREDLGLTGTKRSCDMGRCGACMVLVDGEAVNSCLLMAYQCEGKALTTIEGLRGPADEEIQSAFLQEGAFQCGYCTSGMIMTVKGLLDSNPEPDREEIEEALSGNLCRCTGYGPIVRAVEAVIRQRQGSGGL
ncbi:(2Fe-2S)-binding protein [Paenibacillus caseinilyticus]|uniref:Xanthine dehydrogenase n=1 Tax=Paenibacillus mucilaginosus K02 TaxID=997761 RepID=I0BJK8_9BACL|nr:(2Fe-2S)-binding protein [Paenibacillus mucilaginosus]AFH62555.1 xanthine dehydrogenase [Paenibacillus mucilaginosus K02]